MNRYSHIFCILMENSQSQSKGLYPRKPHHRALISFSNDDDVGNDVGLLALIGKQDDDCLFGKFPLGDVASNVDLVTTATTVTLRMFVPEQKFPCSSGARLVIALTLQEIITLRNFKKTEIKQAS